VKILCKMFCKMYVATVDVFVYVYVCTVCMFFTLQEVFTHVM
jgi:hypothetical protein